MRYILSIILAMLATMAMAQQSPNPHGSVYPSATIGAGTNIIQNFVLGLTSAGGTAKVYVTASNPNGYVDGRPGDHVYDTGGKEWVKVSGTDTNTGWELQRTTINGSASLNFGNTTAQSSTDLTITVTGAVTGDFVALGTPTAAILANSCYTAWVSSTNTVTVRFNNYSTAAQDPAAGTFNVAIIH